MKELTPGSARKVCLLMAMAYKQEAKHRAGELPLPSHLRPDPTETAELFRHLAKWIETECGLRPVE